MKQKLMFAAVLAALGTTAAHAQSSVTLYGLIDEGISYTNNSGGHSLVKLTDAMMQSSRWGMRGAEDLGGGLKAIFVLENGYTLSNGKLGQGGREFGRNAYVGLSSNQFGTVTLGRQNEFMYESIARYSLVTGNNGGGNIFSHAMDNDNLIGTFRVNNAVKYTSPTYLGLQGGAMYAFSNVAGNVGNNRLYSFNLQYNQGPISAALAYTQLNQGLGSGTALVNNVLTPVGVATNTGGAVDSNSSTSDSAFTAGRERIFGGGLKYTFGPAKVGIAITDSKYDNTVGFSTGATTLSRANSAYVHFTNYEVNATYNVTPALLLGAGYTYTDGKFSSALGSASPKWNQVGLFSDYSLSKRTDVYLAANWSHLSNPVSKTATGGVATGFQGAVSNIGGAAAISNQVVVGTGIRTRF
jgi:general bacterial porin, GBP family